MKVMRRENRNSITIEPAKLDKFVEAHRMWHETPEEIRAGLEWGRRKQALLRWVRRQMGRRLTLKERRGIELRFFHNLTFAEMGDEMQLDAVNAWRMVQASVKKLQKAAQEDNSWREKTTKK